MRYLYSTLLLLAFSASINAEEIAKSLKQRVESADNIYFGFVSGIYYPKIHELVEENDLFLGLVEEYEESNEAGTRVRLDNERLPIIRSPEKQMVIVAIKETFQGKPKKEIKASTGLYGWGNDVFVRRVAVFENRDGAEAILLDLKTYKQLINKEYLNDTF